jgi:hypothetical protein
MKTDPVRDWELERFLLGELPDERINEIEVRMKTDSKLKERIHVLKQSNEETLQQYKSSDMTPKIEWRIKKEKANQKKRTKPFLTKRLFYSVPAISAALVILFFVFQNPNRDINFSLPNGTRIKGTMNIDRSKPHLLVYRKNDKDVDLLQDGDEAKAGDLLQIAYGSANENYGVILSYDGNGTVTLHYPENGSDSALLGDQKIVMLSLAYELDEAPDYERFFFVTSKSEIDVQGVMDTAKLLAQDSARARIEKLQLSNSYSQYSVLLKKENINE